MANCRYCNSDFESDFESQDYLTHLAEEHLDEVSRIDRRRLEDQWEGDLEKLIEERDRESYRWSAIQVGGLTAAGVFLLGILVVGLL